MRKFLAEHAAVTTGTLSCFDRLLFNGHLPLGYPHAREVFITLRGVLFKDLKAFVLKQAERLTAPAQAMAARTGRPYEYCESPVRKNQRARAIAARDDVPGGLVCVFATLEACRSFRLAYGHGPPDDPTRLAEVSVPVRLLPRPGVRLVPRAGADVVPVHAAGRRQRPRVAKPGRWTSAGCGTAGSRTPSSGSRIRGACSGWPTASRRWTGGPCATAWRAGSNPLLRDELKGYRYDWATDQAEYATDVLFTTRTALHTLAAVSRRRTSGGRSMTCPSS